MIREQRLKELHIQNFYLPISKQCIHFIFKAELNAFQSNEIFLNRLTNPSSPGPGKVTARFRPFSSKAFISMPKLDSGCLSQFCNTVFTSILCQIPVPGFMSSFKDRIPVYLVPSFMGLISLRICTNTVVGFWTCLKYIHNCAFTTLLYCILELNLKKQHFGFPSICTRKSAINEWKEQITEQGTRKNAYINLTIFFQTV